jgi:hypothetical protein
MVSINQKYLQIYNDQLKLLLLSCHDHYDVFKSFSEIKMRKLQHN